MQEFTLERSLMNVKSVLSVLAPQYVLGDLKKYTLGRDLMNGNIVASVSVARVP